MTEEMYRLLEDGAAQIGQAAYAAQREEYLRTHKTAKQFRYAPTADHRFLVVLLGTSAVDARGLHDLITSYQSYVIMRGAPPTVSRVFQVLAEELATMVPVALEA